MFETHLIIHPCLKIRGYVVARFGGFRQEAEEVHAFPGSVPFKRATKARFVPNEEVCRRTWGSRSGSFPGWHDAMNYSSFSISGTSSRYDSCQPCGVERFTWAGI